MTRSRRKRVGFSGNRELQEVLDRITDGLFVLDRQWILTFVNRSGTELLRRENLVGRHFLDAFPEAEGSEFYRRYQEAMETLRPHEFESFYEPWQRWFAVHAYPSAEGLTVYFRDVTEKKNYEQKLIASSERFELVTRATHDLVFDWDIVNDKVWRSEGLEKALRGCEHLRSVPVDGWFELVHPDDVEPLRSLFRRFIDSDETSVSYEYRFQRFDGTYAHLRGRGCAVRDADGRAIRLIGATTDVSDEKEFQQALEQSREKLRALSRSLLRAQENERRRIARDLHDQLGQSLTALKYGVRELQGADPEKIRSLTFMIDETIDSVRSIARELRPAVLDQLGLVPAIEREVREFSVRTGLQCAVAVRPKRVNIVKESKITVFRILQEALTNVARHAEASSVSIRIGQGRCGVVMTIRDDGKGISPAALENQESLGVLGMKERALLIGGKLEISSPNRGGTVVRLTIPLEGAQ